MLPTVTRRALASVLLLAPTVAAPRVATAQERGTSVREVVDALVQGERLVTVERTPCTTAQESFGAEHCASLIARDAATDAERWRTPLPFPLRGLLQIDEASTDAGVGLFVRAHDRGALFDPHGAVIRTLEVPTSALPRPVGFEEARGALVFRESDGCAALVTSRSDPTVRVLVHGVESHVYPHGGGPHDTVCFGFEVRPVGELRVGTRPAGRGRRGELRHGISSLVIVAVTSVAHPTPIEPTTLVALGPTGVVWQRAVASEGVSIESTRMTGAGAGARCEVVVRGERARTEVALSCLDGRVLGRGPAPEVEAPAEAGARATYDRHGMVVFPSGRCVVRDEGGRHLVTFDGATVLETASPVLVLAQHGDACLALETLPGGGDRLHRVGPAAR